MATISARRIPTKVMVQSIDVTELEAKALAYVHDASELRPAISPDATECSAGFKPHGYVEAPTGLYALSSEGIGWQVTEKNPYILEFFPGKPPQEGKPGFFVALPACSIKLNAAQLKELAKGDKVNLADFIRTFGRRLDENYEGWRRLLEVPQPKEA